MSRSAYIIKTNQLVNVPISIIIRPACTWVIRQTPPHFPYRAPPFPSNSSPSEGRKFPKNRLKNQPNFIEWLDIEGKYLTSVSIFLL